MLAEFPALGRITHTHVQASVAHLTARSWLPYAIGSAVLYIGQTQFSDAILPDDNRSGWKKFIVVRNKFMGPFNPDRCTETADDTKKLGFFVTPKTYHNYTMWWIKMNIIWNGYLLPCNISDVLNMGIFRCYAVKNNILLAASGPVPRFKRCGGPWIFFLT